MEKQFHLGNPHLIPDMIPPVRESFMNKPRGGLWTSTYKPELGSWWIQWMMHAEFNIPEDYIFNGVLLTPSPDARILKIDSLYDLHNWIQIWGMNPYPDIRSLSRPHSLTLDFKEIAKKYDAVHLTEKGNRETHLSQPHSTYPWDCESTVWFRWKFNKVEPITLVMADEYDENYEYKVKQFTRL